ncbi:MAG TPA: DUF4307 domain-containing protein [Mycobacteriales bacterium]|nr:DUF4307 domain-containing protein [Mycobacteriales bacterium]
MPNQPPGPLTAAGRRVPADRYGRPREGARPGWRIALGVVGAVLLAGVVGLALWIATPAVSDGVTGYQVLSARAVRVDFVVHKPPGSAAVCVVQAVALDGGTVGQRSVVVPAGSGRVALSVVVPTTALAITGDLASCNLR